MTAKSLLQSTRAALASLLAAGLWLGIGVPSLTAAPPEAPVRNDRDDANDVIAAERDAHLASRPAAPRREFVVKNIRPADIGIWFEPGSTETLVVADVNPDGALARMGFMEGDRIQTVNDVRVRRGDDFIKALFAAEHSEGRVEVLVFRKNKEQIIVVEPHILIEEYQADHHDPVERLGVVIDDRYNDRIVVWKVVPRSPAFYGGIRAGDVITKFRGQAPAQRAAFIKSISKLESGVVELEVARARRHRPIQIDLPEDWQPDSTTVREERAPADRPRRQE